VFFDGDADAGFVEAVRANISHGLPLTVADRKAAAGRILGLYPPIKQHRFMAAPPESTKNSLGQRLRERARERWPALAQVDVRHRGGFAYISGTLLDGTVLPLCRLRYVGYANQWGFAIYLASKNGYQDSTLPSGMPAGTAEEALDCACGLYLNDPTAWRPG
jgi:hypothetical protein